MHIIRRDGQANCGLPVQRATGRSNAQRLVAETCVPCARAYLARRLDLWHRSGCRGPRPTLVPWSHIGLDEPGWISRQLGQ